MEKRTYRKTELAQLYCPEANPDNARKTLRRWMRYHPTLMQKLIQSGYNPWRKFFLRQEVQIIVDCLGEP